MSTSKIIPFFFRLFALILTASLGSLSAQTPEVTVATPKESAPISEVSITAPKEQPVIGRFLRPFHLEKRIVPPAKLTNSARLESLLRGGNLYLSVQDVIALVLENNLDIAVQRYSPFLSREILRRAEGGGFLRSADTPVVAGPSSVSVAGISSNATGIGVGGVNSGGGVVTQIGPSPPNLDPGIFFQTGASHSTTPLTITLLNETSALVNSGRFFVAGFNQTLITGTNFSFTFYNSRSFQNSPTPLFNPAISGYVDFSFNQPLLQGFSPAVNSRDIRVARNNMEVSDMVVRMQVATTVSAALNLYWDLVSFIDAVRIKQEALKSAEDLLEGNKKQVAIGALAGIEVTRAAAAVSVSKEDLQIAQTNVEQQEIVLKNMLNRNSIENTWLDDVHIIPLDHIEIPKTEEIRPIQDMIQEAMNGRLELKRENVNLQSQKIMLKGDKNAILPSLSAFFELTNHGLSGPPNPYYNNCCGSPNSYFIGGDGTALGQLLRRNFPDYSAGISLNIPFRNRAAQADYVTDQLQLRQAELQHQRTINQVRVEVKTNVIGLQQARSRYETAVASRVLAEQTLEAEQKRFQAGVGSVALVIAAQQSLAATQDSEVQAMANYTHNKISLDMALGRTLDVNHISMDEAISGHVRRDSVLPANLPAAMRTGGAK